MLSFEERMALRKLIQQKAAAKYKRCERIERELDEEVGLPPRGGYRTWIRYDRQKKGAE